MPVKTMLLHMLTQNHRVVPEVCFPTLIPVAMNSSLGTSSSKCSIWVANSPAIPGGTATLRPLRVSCTWSTLGDRDRVAEAKKRLDTILASGELDQAVPVLVLGNKIDLPTATSKEELQYALGLMDTTCYGKDKGPVANNNNDVRPIELYMSSVIRRMGYSMVVSVLQLMCWFVMTHWMRNKIENSLAAHV